jgi:hypothetical protein
MLLFRLNGKGPPDCGCNYHCDDDPEEGAHGCVLCLLCESRSLSTVVSKLVARRSLHCAGHHKNNGLPGKEAIREYNCLACLSAFSGREYLGNSSLLHAERMVMRRRKPIALTESGVCISVIGLMLAAGHRS